MNRRNLRNFIDLECGTKVSPKQGMGISPSKEWESVLARNGNETYHHAGRLSSPYSTTKWLSLSVLTLQALIAAGSIDLKLCLYACTQIYSPLKDYTFQPDPFTTKDCWCLVLLLKPKRPLSCW